MATALLHMRSDHDECERRLRLALSSTNGEWWDWDVTRRVFASSEGYRNLYGMPPGKETSSHSWLDYVHAEDRERCRAYCERFFARGTTFMLDFRIVHPESGLRWLTACGRLERDAGGKPLHFTGVTFDVTEHKRAEEELAASRATLEAALASMSDAVCISDPAGNVVQCNEACVPFYRFGSKDECPRTVAEAAALFEFFTDSGEQLAFEQWPLARALGGEAATGAEYTVQRKDTGASWAASYSFSPIRGENGEVVGGVIAGRDVTGRKRATKELRATLESISDAFIAYDADWRFIYVNATAERILNTRREELLGKNRWEMFPDSLGTLVEQEYRRAAAGEVGDFENFYEPWGRWFHIRCFPREGGGISVYFRDVTERKRAEEALRESEARYRLLHESLRDPFVQTTIEGRIIAFNALYAEMLGYTPEELNSLTIQDLTPERWRAMEDAIIREQVIRRGYSELYEKEYRRKDGTIIPVELRIVLCPGGAGRPPTKWAIVRDITARKRHEEHVELLMREVNHRSKNLLSVIQAIVRMTEAKGTDDFVQRFEERIQALAANQDLLVHNGWQGAQIERLVCSQLGYLEELVADRITLSGPPLMVLASSAQTLGMALHELATNAGKYGALSNATGRVRIAWGVERGCGGSPRFAMAWSESGGPPVSPPEHSGFGSIVVRDMVKMGLNAEVDLDYAPTGLVWRFSAPLDRVVGREGALRFAGERADSGRPVH